MNNERAIKLRTSIYDNISNFVAYIILAAISVCFGLVVCILPWIIGVYILNEIAKIILPDLSLILFAAVLAIEIFTIATTEIESTIFGLIDLTYYVLWDISLVLIGYIDNNMKLELSGTEAFIISLGMPVALVMIIAFIAFIVSCLNKIATRHIDR